jgi:hypothetical protein
MLTDEYYPNCVTRELCRLYGWYQDRPLLLSLRQMYVPIFYLGPSVITANSAVVFVNETLFFLGDTFRCAPNVLRKTRPYGRVKLNSAL